MTELIATNVSVSVSGRRLVDSASLALQPGELVAVLGPNGAGKTTLLRAMLGLLPASGGSVTLDGEPCSRIMAAERARRVAYLPQVRPLAWPNKVRDVVALGRFAHGAAIGRLGTDDSQAVAAAINACDLQALAERSTDSLSGGEIARVHFARALAARAPLLLADEPVAALDPRHQLRIAGLLRSFVDDGGGALVVLHEIALAASIADRLVWMCDGRIVHAGSPADTVNAAVLAEVYGVKAHVACDQHGFDVRIEGPQ